MPRWRRPAVDLSEPDPGPPNKPQAKSAKYVEAILDLNGNPPIYQVTLVMHKAMPSSLVCSLLLLKFNVYFKTDFERNYRRQEICLNEDHPVLIVERGALFGRKEILPYLCDSCAPKRMFKVLGEEEIQAHEMMLSLDEKLLHAICQYLELYGTNSSRKLEKWMIVENWIRVLNNMLKSQPFVCGSHLTPVDYSLFCTINIFKTHCCQVTFLQMPTLKKWFWQMQNIVSNCWKEWTETYFAPFSEEYFKLIRPLARPNSNKLSLACSVTK